MFLDELSGKALKRSLVREARQEELAYIERLGLWERIPRQRRGEGIPILRGRWVDTD